MERAGNTGSVALPALFGLAFWTPHAPAAVLDGFHAVVVVAAAPAGPAPGECSGMRGATTERFHGCTPLGGGAGRPAE